MINEIFMVKLIETRGLANGNTGETKDYDSLIPEVDSQIGKLPLFTPHSVKNGPLTRMTVTG
tara:strand:- start:918 stop:1103 length:186 start_codon:yes stop_codon:yes gene_type:complete